MKWKESTLAIGKVTLHWAENGDVKKKIEYPYLLFVGGETKKAGRTNMGSRSRKGKGLKTGDEVTQREGLFVEGGKPNCSGGNMKKKWLKKGANGWGEIGYDPSEERYGPRLLDCTGDA